MNKFDASYTRLSNMILQMSDDHRMKLLNIAIKMSEGLSYETKYGRSRRNKGNSLMGVYVGFVLGFIFTIFFRIFLDYISELWKPPIL